MIDRIDDRADRREIDVPVDSGAVDHPPGIVANPDVGGRLRRRSPPERVFAVLLELELRNRPAFVQRRRRRFDRPAADSGNRVEYAARFEFELHAGLVRLSRNRPLDSESLEPDCRSRRFENLLAEDPVDLRRREFAPGRFRLALDGECDHRLHLFRQPDSVDVLEHVGHAPFAGLAVDPDQSVVTAPEVGRIDVQIRHLPPLAEEFGDLLPARHSLADRVLVSAGKRGEHELPRVWRPRAQPDSGCLLDEPDHLRETGEIQPRLDSA